MMAEMKQNRTLTIAGAKFWDKTLFDVLHVLTDATVKQILGELIAKIMTMSGLTVTLSIIDWVIARKWRQCQGCSFSRLDNKSKTSLQTTSFNLPNIIVITMTKMKAKSASRSKTTLGGTEFQGNVIHPLMLESKIYQQETAWDCKIWEFFFRAKYLS